MLCVGGASAAAGVSADVDEATAGRVTCYAAEGAVHDVVVGLSARLAYPHRVWAHSPRDDVGVGGVITGECEGCGYGGMWCGGVW